MSLKSSLQQ